ncbi:hypothetical protein GF373_02620 [bacterium]|nr:hypothetical protein [bacterium]
MRRPMTEDEKKRFRGYFPRLDVDRAVVTDNVTSRYNCISWTVGVTTRWLWPGSSIGDFDNFYQKYGYIRSSNGPIAAWGHTKSSMTHGCVSGPGHGPRWESKCGSDLRIQHGLNELVGASYGRVVAFYAKAKFVMDMALMEMIQKINEIEGPQIMVLEEEQQEILRDALNKVSKDIRGAFETLFAEWKKTWSAEEFWHVSNPAFVRYTEPYKQLAAMGDEIVPLVVDKLTDSDNFFALQLYDALQPDEKLVIQPDTEGDEILEGEQGRAKRTVIAWLGQ